MTYILDTNIFLRFFTRDDESQFRIASKILQHIESRDLDVVIPGIVLTEIVWGMKSYYGYTKSHILQVLESIEQLDRPIIDTYDYQVARSLYEATGTKYIDCLIASISQVQNKKWSVLSFDHDFKKFDILWQKPEELKL